MNTSVQEPDHKPRWWRDVGESASLWTNFKLDFIARSPLHLRDVLALPRLQGLQQISLECVQYITLSALLQVVIDYCPGIRKLFLRMNVLKSNIEADEMAMLAETLVKFELVDLTEFCITSTDEGALLEACIKATTTTAKSRIKVLRIHGHRKSHSKAVEAAKGKMKIDIKYGSRHAKWHYS